jgi:hypothetical protein
VNSLVQRQRRTRSGNGSAASASMWPVTHDWGVTFSGNTDLPMVRSRSPSRTAILIEHLLE